MHLRRDIAGKALKHLAGLAEIQAQFGLHVREGN